MSRRVAKQNSARDRRASIRATLTLNYTDETLEQYYKRVEEEGFDLDMTGANDDDPFQKKIRCVSSY